MYAVYDAVSRSDGLQWVMTAKVCVCMCVCVCVCVCVCAFVCHHLAIKVFIGKTAGYAMSIRVHVGDHE